MMETVQKRCKKILQSQLPVVCGFQSQLAHLHRTGVQTRNDFGPSVMDDVDEFTHNVAIKISRVMNSLNPNDLLARRVIDIAKTNSVDGFIKAAAGFGLTQVAFLKELHMEILDHLKQENWATTSRLFKD